MRKILLALLILFVGVIAVSATTRPPGGEPLELSAGFSVDAVLTEGASLEVLQGSVLAEGIEQTPLPRQAILVYITNTGQLQIDTSKPHVNFHLLC
ncbi:hypothetical protein AGMMS49944_08910 [Spirochaetia bacterium]|nr:hypothetical protein AGMMS49944_08910 [Spirochaetia bacterium]